VAGYDVYFRFLQADRPLLVAAVAAARRRARVFNVRVTAELNGEPPWLGYLAFDGQTYALDFFAERLRRDLPTILEATPAARFAPDRRRYANGIIDLLARARAGLYDRYPDDWLPTVRAKQKPAYMLPHQIYPAKAPSLLDRMDTTMHMLASWHYDEIAPEVLLEEIHTAAELLLEKSVNRRSKRLSFTQLVEAAHQAALLRADPTTTPDGIRAWASVIEHGNYLEWANDLGRDVLLSLKDQRKHSRHRGSAGAKEWLDAHFWEAVSVLENLADAALD
jgi:hypothetical protein